MSKKVGVEFLKRWDAYNTGDKAGFKENVAKKLVESNIAAFVSKRPKITVRKPFDKELPYWPLYRAMKDVLPEDELSRDREELEASIKKRTQNPHEYLRKGGYLDDDSE